jgi:hypothetical protein
MRYAVRDTLEFHVFICRAAMFGVLSPGTLLLHFEVANEWNR